ncbi:MAG: hypothetical protein HOV71_28440 [Hamadaea sp.]|nr:hypothetical protein [Hamadaea sp.]NUR52074.1 hypothetical protein [Hamadaea sp.]NUT07187.1 hypothetical protein [Hamadaea sp.]
MTTPDLDEDMPADLARLRNLISCELYDQFSLRQDHLDQADIPEIAYAIARRAQRAFRIEWSPLWQDDTDDDLGSPDAATFHGSATPPERFPIFDHGWPRRS